MERKIHSEIPYILHTAMQGIRDRRDCNQEHERNNEQHQEDSNKSMIQSCDMYDEIKQRQRRAHSNIDSDPAKEEEIDNGETHQKSCKTRQNEWCC
jgi:hypothetical protein